MSLLLEDVSISLIIRNNARSVESAFTWGSTNNRVLSGSSLPVSVDALNAESYGSSGVIRSK
jgi:hypothetical protein